MKPEENQCPNSPDSSVPWHAPIGMVYNPGEFTATESAAMPTTQEPTDPEQSKQPETPETAGKASRSSDRRGIAVAAALLLACGALITYGILDAGNEQADKESTVPTAAVTYEVLGEGAADISYRGDGKGDRANVVKNAELPWKKTVNVPLGTSPAINVTLGEQGGEATCTLAVRGKHVQRATASGTFGRSTCTSEPSTTEASAAPEAAQ
ncbi:MmpS family transport accessory protein [Streptomyces sp. NPDC056352]|uniref:MmpS family transport accessory protein n=1 Tax=Streptomyces sp. NPDC056352 TaxID=3345791 RepID=UPI0035DC662B